MRQTLRLSPGPAESRRIERGFTLVELIAVVVLLGILAAIIVPRYFDLSGKAQTAAYKSALSEAGARLSLSYAQYIAETNQKPSSLADLANATLLGGADLSTVNIGDYDVGYVMNGATVTMTLSNKGKADNVASTTTPWPQ